MPHLSLDQHTSLEDFVRTVLLENGFGDLPQEEQQRLIPEFTEQALVRLGAAIAPRLTEKGVKQFVELTEDDTVTPELWSDFWKNNIPDFTVLAKTTLEQYAEEISVLVTA